MVMVSNVINKDIKHVSVEKRLVRHQLFLDLKDIVIHVRSMVIENKVVDLMVSSIGHLRRNAMYLGKVTRSIGITIHGTIISYAESMDILKQIA